MARIKRSISGSKNLSKKAVDKKPVSVSSNDEKADKGNKVKSLESYRKQMEGIAAIKNEIKGLETELEALEAPIKAGILAGKIEMPEDGKFETALGVLAWQGREYPAIDKNAVFAKLGADSYVEASTISKSGIEKEGGKKTLRELEDAGAIAKGKVVNFFKLTKKK